ncbi:uncharacterized protein CXQ87_000334 [Candidozyma duobushaemuli]|uniref:Uncharacterized protein n=2 Tax=Candidozyma TaxID=3303203 RepID=A0ABX8I2J6_9ASCO|nr:uncharacterized protein CXQ87_000334 [[Candida] duobushaemulonis]PVH17448.1 hypothetical protein CXQ87_000334 [[Candida] duobushaemulonis]QWU86088.1 hypothetical protein CA3LBN_000306 [[Candida] haemuloni]
MSTHLVKNGGSGNVLYNEAVVFSGHEGAVLSAQFSPFGDNIASGGMDRDILLWKLPIDPEEELPNYGILHGHKGAITSLRWTSEYGLFSGSSDTTVAFWDAETGTKKRVGKSHSAIVNDCAYTSQLGFSVGDDGDAIVWDEREKNEVHKFQSEYPLMACEASRDTIYVSGIDSYIRAYDLKTRKLAWKTQAFMAPTTSLALSHDGNMLAARSMDGEIRLVSTKSLMTEGISRVGKAYDGSVGGPQKNLVRVAFSADDSLLGSGSEDPTSVVWGSASRRMVHKLNDHGKAVLDVNFHPTEKIMLTASADSTLVLREL